MSAETFFDTNIVLYALIDDGDRLPIARRSMSTGGIVSVQVLNELTNTLRRKFKLSWSDISAHIGTVAGLVDDVVPLSVAEHARARRIAERHKLQFYDALLIATAIEARCTRFVSEDMQDGLRIDGLVIVNPFSR
jgi:predicted nucleic acid-binding protein